MSWTVAVWDGPRPTSAEHARATLDALQDEGQGEAGPGEPSDRLVALVERLLERWPDIGDDDGVDSPWADGPLLANVRGQLFLCSVSGPRTDEAIGFLRQVAEESGLVCFDPQTDEVYVPAGLPARSAVQAQPAVPARRGWFGRC